MHTIAASVSWRVPIKWVADAEPVGLSRWVNIILDRVCKAFRVLFMELPGAWLHRRMIFGRAK